MKAKCINDKSEEYPNFKGKSSQNKVSGLTKDKSYEVEQSKQYDDYFEVINDLGVKESYKKERFEVMEHKKEKISSNRDKAIAKFEEEIERLKKEIEEGYQCIETKCENKLFLAEQKANETINELKKENEKIIKEKELLESQLENELSRNGILKEKLDKANSESAEYFIRWGDAESKIKKLKEKISCAEQDINRLNTENACLKAFNEKSENRIQHLINSIKNMSEVL